MNKSESKYFNTAIKMDEAFLGILEKKDFAFITVKEICEKAGVNRSTFYLHYETVGDLLSESVEYLQDKFFSRFSGAKDISHKIREGERKELVLITPSYLRTYLLFIREHRKLYAVAIQKPEVFSAQRTFQKMFRYVFDPILERFAVPEEERIYRMRFYLSGISGMIAEWLECNCETPVDTLIKMMQDCILSGRTVSGTVE